MIFLCLRRGNRTRPIKRCSTLIVGDFPDEGWVLGLYHLLYYEDWPKCKAKVVEAKAQS